MTGRSLRRWLSVLGLLIPVLAITAYLWPELLIIARDWVDDAVLETAAVIITCLALGIIFIYLRIVGIVRHYTGALFELDAEDSQRFTNAVMNYIPRNMISNFMLRVDGGRLNPESSAMVKRIGGPGFVSIEFQHIVITSRFGILYRSLGVGFHKLHPFEKVWDVIDLRPQYREITVNFMTADGIPAKCNANIRFRVAAPWQENALRLATSKYVKSASGRNRVSDWTNGIAGGAFDGDIRNTLEQYEVDQLINPLLLYPYDDTLPNSRSSDEAKSKTSPGRAGEDAVTRETSAYVLGDLANGDFSKVDEDAPDSPDSNNVPEPAQPVSLTNLEDEIRESVAATAKDRGIEVTHVEISEVKPTESVLRAWYKLWEANKLFEPGIRLAEENAKQSHKALLTYAQQRAELMRVLGDRANQLSDAGEAALSDLIFSGILDAAFDWDEDTPMMKRALLHGVVPDGLLPLPEPEDN